MATTRKEVISSVTSLGIIILCILAAGSYELKERFKNEEQKAGRKRKEKRRD